VLINFRGRGGQSLQLVSTAGQPFNGEPLPEGTKPGQPNLPGLLPEPAVMQFRVSRGPVTDSFTLPTTVSSSFVPITHDTLPKDHEHRLVVLTQNPNYNEMKMLPFELWEMKDVTGKHKVTLGEAEDGIIQIKGPDGKTKTYRRQSRIFADTVNFFVAYDSWEQWRFPNLNANIPKKPPMGAPSATVEPPSSDYWRTISELWSMPSISANTLSRDGLPTFIRAPVTHPMHVHLVEFQVLDRDVYDISGFNPGKGGTDRPVTFKKHGVIDPNERGRKDTIRVGPGEAIPPFDTGEIVSIAARFTGGTGQFMYHCHLIGHEDEGMMRPFAVMPAEVMKLDPTMEGHGGHAMPM